MKKVYYFVGPEKTGTTLIYEYVNLGLNEALHNGDKEKFTLSRYNNLQREISNIESVEGDYISVEPTYFVSENANSAIREIAKKYDVTVVHTHRDKFQRTISHYLHQKNKGRISDVNEALAKHPEIIEASNYNRYSCKWRDIEGIKFIELSFDSLISNPALEISKIIECEYSLLKDIKLGKVNERLAPKNMLFAKYATKISDLLRMCGLSSVVRMINRLGGKKVFYYGGEKTGITQSEREELEKWI